MKKVISRSIITLVIMTVIIVAWRLGYIMGHHNATLSVKEATTTQLARAMQSDDFYASYSSTMLLVNGTVKTVNQQGHDTIVEFETTTGPSVLPKVSCEFTTPVYIAQGQTIRVLTVAYDAQRKNTADVLLSNCYLVKTQ